MLRISARAPGQLPAEHHGQTTGGAVHQVTQHIAGQPTGQDMFNTIADRYISTAEKRAPRFRMASSTTAGFRRPHRASRGDRFPSRPGKAARLADQQRLTGGGQRRPVRRASSATW